MIAWLCIEGFYFWSTACYLYFSGFIIFLILAVILIVKYIHSRVYIRVYDEKIMVIHRSEYTVIPITRISGASINGKMFIAVYVGDNLKAVIGGKMYRRDECFNIIQAQMLKWQAK